MSERLKGEGDVVIVRRTKVRATCEQCGEPATYRHSYLLENYRRNPASSGYGKDDCSFCEDAFEFTCRVCSPELTTRQDGYTGGSRYEVGGHFDHLFLVTDDVIIDRIPAEANSAEK